MNFAKGALCNFVEKFTLISLDFITLIFDSISPRRHYSFIFACSSLASEEQNLNTVCAANKNSYNLKKTDFTKNVIRSKRNFSLSLVIT